MNKFHLRWLRPLLLPLVATLSAADTDSGKTQRPDIVVFLADDLSIRDVSAYGDKQISTPNMQALANAGMTFDRAYVASPSCAPSRAALLTGRFASHTGARYNHQRVRPDVRKWPAYFHDLGYEVVAIGKVSHYGHVNAYGFDYAAYHNYHEDICIQKAVEWLEARKSDRPLCLLVGTNWPHVPWPNRQALPPDRVKLSAKLANTPETRTAFSRYAAAVENADRDLGLIRDAVARTLPKDTICLFTSDHGSQFPFEKWTLYESGIRVPLIVAWPGRIAPGTRTNAMVSWVDVLPTLLEVAGEMPAQLADFDGRSFLPVLLDGAKSHREMLFATHSGDGNFNTYPTRSLRDGRWKYIRNLDPSREFRTHVTERPQNANYWLSWEQAAKSDPDIAKLVERYLRRPPEELYDLEKDPDELVNLATDPAHASHLARMREALDRTMRDLDDGGLEADLAAHPRNQEK